MLPASQPAAEAFYLVVDAAYNGHAAQPQLGRHRSGRSRPVLGLHEGRQLHTGSAIGRAQQDHLGARVR